MEFPFRGKVVFPGREEIKLQFPLARQVARDAAKVLTTRKIYEDTEVHCVDSFLCGMNF